MILQALKSYYDRSEQLPREGWIRRGVDYILVLDTDGRCVNIEAIGELKKGKTIPREMLLPSIDKQALKHTNSGKDANLLWDNASFIFGTGNKGKQKLASFIDALHTWFADCLNDAGITAIQRFCQAIQANPESVVTMLTQFQVIDDFNKRDPVLAFRLNSDIEAIHARPTVRSLYEKRLQIDHRDTIVGNCLITGERNVVIASNETVIKNVWGAQPSGANILSFNARAFESYGKRDRNGENAPTSKTASFAYTTALNHLLTSRQRMQVGDASTVFWAEKNHPLETMLPDLFGEPPKDNPDRGKEALRALYQAVQSGKFTQGADDTRFHVLGLAPNASRIAIRFWETATAHELAKCIASHFDDIKIARASYDPEHLSLFRLLKSVALQEKADNIPPNLGGEIMRSILERMPYPISLLNLAVQRCRAEQHPTYARAAAIKAVLNRAIRRDNMKALHPEKEFEIMLDPANINPPYRLGRLFATLEKIQEEASSGLNATIRDRYYGAASSMPVAVFATLLRLKNHHLGKLPIGRAVQMEKLIGEIMNALNDFPRILPLPDQGRFALGYYHQRQSFFTKSETANHQEESK